LNYIFLFVFKYRIHLKKDRKIEYLFNGEMLEKWGSDFFILKKWRRGVFEGRRGVFGVKRAYLMKRGKGNGEH
jgi:hypothetical protein